MVDAVAVFPPGFRLLDANGDPVSGGTISFYNAGTSAPRTVYSDLGLSTSLGAVVYTNSDGVPVASEGSSTAVMVYTGSTAYKIIFKDGSGTTLFGGAFDNIKGALDTSTFLTTGSTSTLTQPVISKTGNYTVVAADRSKLIECNTTGGQFTLTLTAAATLGDNWSVKIRNSGTANQFILAASQNIAFEGQTFTARAFQIGEAAEIICDGTGFKLVGYTPPLMASRDPGIIRIADRVTSDPSATAGARYIVQTGYGSYATGDIIESNGSTFNKYTPPTDCGWLAYVQDEDAIYQFQASAWAQIIPIPAASDTLAGRIELAVQSEMEAATDVARAVVPGRQHFHPVVAKAQGKVNSSGTQVGVGYNIASTTRTSTGVFTITMTNAMASTDYGVIATVVGNAGFGVSIEVSITSTTVFVIRIRGSASDTLINADMQFAVFGDMP